MLNRLLLTLLLLGAILAVLRHLKTRDPRWLTLARRLPQALAAFALVSFFWVIAEHWRL